jgi:hypothetical protein
MKKKRYFDGSNKTKDSKEFIKQRLRIIVDQLPEGSEISISELMDIYNAEIDEINNGKNPNNEHRTVGSVGSYRSLMIDRHKVKDSRTFSSYIEKIISENGMFSLRRSKSGNLLVKALSENTIAYDYAVIGQEGNRSLDFYKKDGNLILGPTLITSDLPYLQAGTIYPEDRNRFYFTGAIAGTVVVQAGTIGIRHIPQFKKDQQPSPTTVTFLDLSEK